MEGITPPSEKQNFLAIPNRLPFIFQEAECVTWLSLAARKPSKCHCLVGHIVIPNNIRVLIGKKENDTNV